MISAIEELIYIAADRTETEDYQGKHGAKAKKGWYRYDTRLAYQNMMKMENLKDIIYILQKCL